MAKVPASRPKPHRAPGFLLGIGLGGFLDGIAFHQILQWHQMGSAVLPPDAVATMRQNMRWDGWFHLAMLALTVLGLFLLLREANRGHQMPVARSLVGQLLLGWGAFNVVEGVVDHVILHIHHVHDLPAYAPIWDWVFLAASAVILLVGWLLATRGDIAARTRVRATDLLVRSGIDS